MRWVVTSDEKSKILIELVLRGPDDDSDFKVTFLERSNKIRNGFVFPDTEDVVSAKRSGIVSVLSETSCVVVHKGLFRRFDIRHRFIRA